MFPVLFSFTALGLRANFSYDKIVDKLKESGDVMKYEVLGRQYVSHHCFVCGTKNVAGLQAKFYHVSDAEIIGVFTGGENHASYPHRMHGGVIAALLDETIGRAILLYEPEVFGVTVELNLQYKKPVPLGVELAVKGRVTENRSRLFSGSGEILLPSGEVAVTAIAKYMKMPLEKIADGDMGDETLYYETDNRSQVIIGEDEESHDR